MKTERHSLLLGLFLCAALITGCGETETEASSLDAGCTAGSLGCTCRLDLRCGTGPSGQRLACEAGLCVEEGCRAGTEGCPCAANNRCGLASTGEALTCQNGTCVADTCPAGSAGCPCLSGGTCTNASETCRDGFCQPSDCVPGELNCSCLGGSCSSATLVCQDEVLCVDATGRLGGPCFDDGTCNAGLRCDANTCAPCAPGSLDCSCAANDSCVAGLACNLAKRCAVPGEGVAPASPLCFTPCQSGLTVDGEYRACPADGLMPGCVGGLECRGGSCVATGAAPVGCASDLECPDFQTCIEGRCFSTCEHDGQCLGEKRCYRHVCRLPCEASTSQSAASGCDAVQYCNTLDGENGFCMPLAPTTGEPQREVDVGFAISKTSFELTNALTRATLRITNESPSFQRFTVRKRSHLRMLADGSSESLDDPADSTECNPASDCPLTWLRIGPAGTSALTQSFEIGIDAGATAEIELAGAGDNSAPRWQGTLEISLPKGHTATVGLNYAERPEGQWQGTLYYFATFGDRNLSPWRATQSTRDNQSLTDQVGNALIQRWGAFRRGRISWEELQAVLNATTSASWNWSSVKNACPASASGRGACYLYDIGTSGVAAYSSDLESYPIPTGVTEYPMAMNLRLPDAATSPGLLEGRLESSYAMQYAGNPAVTLQFATNPSECARTAFGTCITFLDTLEADILLGGRYQTTPDDTNCAQAPTGTFVQKEIPWLVPGLQRATTLDSSTGQRFRHECRSKQLPFASSDPAENAALQPLNALLSQANPIPDGRSRKRELRLVDGALINQSQLFILFEERFASFLGTSDTDGFTAYGYMLLKRAPADVDADDENGNGVPDGFEGAEPSEPTVQPQGLLDVQCSAELLDPLLHGAQLSATNAADVVNGLISGRMPDAAPEVIGPASLEKVHYYCEDTGLFDAGPENFTGANGEVRTACPVGSKVVFFTVLTGISDPLQVVDNACQQTKTCGETLVGWRNSGTTKLVQYEPLWTCADANEVYCNDDRFDLRNGKKFFQKPVAGDSAVFLPIYSAIEQAFRYRTRFVNRSGTTVGFAPAICVSDSNLVPYCYDPEAIEQLRERIDCLLSIWKNHPLANEAPARTLLDDYLRTDFAYKQRIRPDNTIEIRDGFERLYAELLIMMGDEAYTAAFSSRFDLAGSHAVSFQGSRFEEGGVDLAGAAGYELYTLYMSMQYYQETLDRFYALSPLVWASLNHPQSSRNFIGLETAVRYFDKLVRASTQKSRAASEIARRYQALNRPDLARRVIERTYTAGYLESIVMSRLMVNVIDTATPQEKDPLLTAIEDAQRRYRAAGAEMRKVYGSIADDETHFGLAPDYVPLPALDANQPNAFELVVARAQERVRVAREREDLALSSSRSYETDAAQFQSELARIRQTYENQLGNLCGTFVGSDGRVYPATVKYAALNDRASLLGDPCGLMGNGQIHEAMGQFELMQLDLRSAITSTQNVLTEVDVERLRVAQQCALNMELADYTFRQQGAVLGLRTTIAGTRNFITVAERAVSSARTFAELAKCSMIVGVASGGDCPTAGIAAAMFGGASTPLNAAISGGEIAITTMEAAIGAIELQSGKWQTQHQCAVAQVDSNARTMTLLLRLKELEVEMLKAQRRIDLAIAELEQQRNEAIRLRLEQEEAEQLAINVEAARNDPNVRIYKNDAIINADFSFDDALREAYRATKVFEYYTSQTYGGRDQLYLIRMVARGDYNLENYLLELQNEFASFEETYGNPDTRVQIISLRDDVLAVPRLAEDGTALGHSERLALFRAKLRDTRYLDENGYLSFPFSTSVNELSPLTRNHKVLYVEAEICGDDNGDTLGRVYLRQRGTGVVRGVSGDRDYYRLPERTAVINPVFNAVRVYAQEVYRTYRLRDRPYANTAWELVLNQRDEQVNKDINLQSLTDVRLFVYYTDFTEL